MRRVFLFFLSIVASVTIVMAQNNETPNFRELVEKKLKDSYRIEFSRICPIDADPVADRVFRDYGAIFVTNNGGKLPSKCIFDSEEEVESFQHLIGPEVMTIGGVRVTLQKAAMTALVAARAEASKLGLAITPRGGTEASTRSYERTVGLWRSRFDPGLSHWMAKGKIKRDEAANAQRAPIRKQVEMVLAWEEQGFYFSTDFSKSILYSVAAPGASQHIFMLALDVEQFASKEVRQVLANHGWFQTVKSDLPHFTFLGVAENDLPALGLKRVIVSGQTFWIPNL